MKFPFFSRRNRKSRAAWRLARSKDPRVRLPEGYEPVRRRGMPFKNIRFTLAGPEGKPWRIALCVAAGLLVGLLLWRVTRVEPQLTNTPEVITVQKSGVLRVGVRTDIPGMAENGEGLEAELARLLAQRLLPDIPADNSYQLVEVNAMSVGAKFNDGSIDAAIAMMPRNASSQYTYSRAYFTDTCRLIAGMGATSLRLENISVGCVQGTPSDTLLAAYIEAHPAANIQALKYASYPDMLSALMQGKLELCAMTDVYIHKYQNEVIVNPQTLISRKPYAFQVSSVDLGSVDYAIVSAAESPAIARFGDMLLGELKESGRLKTMYEAYGMGAYYAYDKEETN